MKAIRILLLLVIVTLAMTVPVSANEDGIEESELVAHLLKAKDSLTTAEIATAWFYVPWCKGPWKKYAEGKVPWLQTASYCTNKVGCIAGRLYIEANTEKPPRGWTKEAWNTLVERMTGITLK